MKTSPIILQIALPVPLRRCFDYLPPEEGLSRLPLPGVRVQVPFGRRKMVGILVGTTDKASVPQEKLKPVFSVMEEEPVIASHIMSLCQFASRYYQVALGEVLFAALPKRLRVGKPVVLSKEKTQLWVHQDIPPLLNAEQLAAVSAILSKRDQFQCFLLDGVTGSGKTEVYLQIIADCLARGKQALVLIPEISLTPQTVLRFRRRFAVTIEVLHSSINETQKLNAWIKAKEGVAKIIIGTRSAVFVPLRDPGIIIVDEEHDASFKQQEGFYYHARDLALVRAQMEKIPIVLGTATPSSETYGNAIQKKYERIILSQRAGIANLPKFHVLDIRREVLQHGLSPRLIEAMGAHLAAGNQVMVFVNRRGYAPVLMCHDCGHLIECRHCDAKLVWHQSTQALHCHHCEKKYTKPKVCPSCQGKQLIFLGVATEKLEETLSQLFPTYTTVRVDRDTVRRKGDLETRLDTMTQNRGQILIGTQMIAKGHHFPQMTLVAILDMDHCFWSTDFKATERMAQLLLQVAGRAGRDEKPGEVFIQTRLPTHPLLLTLLQQGYHACLDIILKERESVDFPPFQALALFRIEAKTMQRGLLLLDKIKTHGQGISSHVKILGPIPAPQEKKQDRYRAQLLVKAENKKMLQDFLSPLTQRIEEDKIFSAARWSVDIDPVDLS